MEKSDSIKEYCTMRIKAKMQLLKTKERTNKSFLHSRDQGDPKGQSM